MKTVQCYIHVFATAFYLFAGVMHSIAGEIMWIGGAVVDGVGSWTNAANWAGGIVPGRYLDASGAEAGATGFSVAFTVGDEDLTVDLDGLLSVGNLRVTGDGTGGLTFGTRRDQSLRMESDGLLMVDETVVSSPRLLAGLGSYSCKGEASSDLIFTATNASKVATLLLTDIGDAMILGGNPGAWFSRKYGFSGIGAVRVDGERRGDGAVELVLACSRLIVGQTPLRIHTLSVEKASGPQTIEISEGGVLRVGANGGYGMSKVTNFGLDIVGGGEFRICGGMSGNVWMNGINTFGNSDTTISCAIFAGEDMSGMSPANPVGLRTREGETTHPSWSAGTVNLRSPDCRLAGNVEMYNATWARAGSLGLNGEQGSFGWCTNFYLMNNARIIYEGSGETTDRILHIGRSEPAKVAVLDKYVANASIELEQAGTGPLVVESPIDYTEALDGVSPRLSLINDTNWPATWAGDLSVDGLSVEKRGTGLWILSGDNSYTGETRISGGTLRLAHVGALAGSSIALAGGRLELPRANGGDASCGLPPLSVSGDSSLFIGSGMQVALESLAVADGKTLHITTEDDAASVRVVGAAEGVAQGVTLNGAQASFNDQGVMVAHVTAWKVAESGRWADAANWTGGVPSQDESARIAMSADALDVTVDSGASVSNLQIRNARGLTTLKISAAFDVPEKGAVSVGNGAKIAFMDGGSAQWQGLSALDVEDGGTLALHGGVLELSGTLLEGDGRIDMTAGSLYFAHAGWYDSLSRLSGAKTHSLSGSARIVDNNQRPGAFFCDGVLDFRGNSSFCRENQSASVVAFSSCTDTGSCVLSFGESASMDAEKMLFILGCPSSGMSLAAPSSVLTFDSDAVSRVGGIWAGVERTNLAQVEVKRGEVQVGSYGIRLGGTWESYWSRGSVARGVMKVSGGAVTVGGLAYNGYYAGVAGVCVGEGMNDGRDGNEDFRYSGRFELDGGAVTNTQGFFCIGGGRADGEFIQNGGTFCQQLTETAGKYPCPQIVGAFTGGGLYAVSNGVARFETGESMYVGGISLDDMRRAGYFSLATDVSKILERIATEPNAASGKVEVAGGSLVSNGGLVLGADGRGEISIVGSRSEARFASLVMSNAVESVARFVFDADGVRPLKIDGLATITDGARLEVDLSSYAGPAKPFRLIDCASRMGDFPESGIKITGATGRYAGTSVVYTGRGVRLRIPCGTVVLFR